jgi:hypothetical protein
MHGSVGTTHPKHGRREGVPLTQATPAARHLRNKPPEKTFGEFPEIDKVIADVKAALGQ